MGVPKMIRHKPLLVAAILILVVQAVASHTLRRNPVLPNPPRLGAIPLQLGEWSQLREQVIAPESLKMLGPDDFLARLYQTSNVAKSTAPEEADLFVAYYRTQLQAKSAHDPKVCLPGSGWNPTESRMVSISTGPDHTIPANYYRIKKSDKEQVVLYWFQTFDAVYTLEQDLKIHRIWGAMLNNRTDMALVRIVVPVTSKGVGEADAKATQFAQVIYQQMLSYFPPTEKIRS